jgi:hypothetical protein
LIQQDQAPQNNSWDRQQGYHIAKLTYALRFSDRINTSKTELNGMVVCCSVHRNRVVSGRMWISVVCDAKHQLWDDNVSDCTAKIMVDPKCVLSCLSRASGADQG